jgi:hypothetical protein
MPKVPRSVVVAVEAIASKSRYHRAEPGAAMEKVRRRARVAPLEGKIGAIALSEKREIVLCLKTCMPLAGMIK